jgi:DNA repair ATPase RecN
VKKKVANKNKMASHQQHEYHFQSDDVDTEFITDMQTAQTVPTDVLKQLIQASIKILTGESQLASLEVLYEALTPLSERAEASPKKLAGTVRSLAMFYQGATRKNLKVDLFKEDCEKLGYDEERTNLLANVYKKYFVSLSRVLVAQTLTVNPLKDMDWRFGVTASTSEVNQVGTTFLQLKLVVGDEKVFLELSLPQFYDFLHQMEKAKAALDFFQSS